MYAWIVLYRRNASDRFYVSSEAYWSMADAQAFIESRANNPKPPIDCGGVPCYQYITETRERSIALVRYIFQRRRCKQ